MSKSVPHHQGLRMKPLAAGLAMVFAVGVFTLPTDTGAATRASAGRHALLAQQPRMAPLLAQHQAKRQALVQSRVSGDEKTRAALRAELKVLRGQLHAEGARLSRAESKSTAPATIKGSLAQLRDRLKFNPTTGNESNAALLAQARSRSAQRLAMLQEKWGTAAPARNNAPAAVKATHIVTSCADDGSAGTLRSVIDAAVSGDTVDLTQLTCSTITLASGGIWVPQDGLSIEGPGAAALSIDADNNGTVFDFGGYSGELAISGVTLTNAEVEDWSGGAIWAYAGDVTLRNAVISDSSTFGYYYNVGGSAIAAYDGNITLENSVISGNESYSYDTDVTGAVTSFYGNVVMIDSQVSGNESYGYNAWAEVSAQAGTVTLTDSTVSGNMVTSYQQSYGGGIFSMGGVSLAGSTVTGNMASSYDGQAIGGGILSAGVVSLVNSNISGNTAAVGAGVVAAGGSLSVVDSRISDNTSTEQGGGIFAGYADLTINNSTISGNEAGIGAGIVSLAGSAQIIGSTVSGNSATYLMGGGVVCNYGDLVLTNTTISGNSSNLWGGGVIAAEGAVTLSNSTITGNSAQNAAGIALYEAQMTMNSTIVFGNIELATPPAGVGADIAEVTNGSIVLANSAANLVGDSGIALPAGTLSTNPLLGPLGNNGGLTQTHALGVGSPAINAGNNLAALDNDQRGTGFDRVVGGAADIGAFEVQGGAGPVPIAAPMLVPASSTWALGLLGTLLGFFGWRRGWFSREGRGKA